MSKLFSNKFFFLLIYVINMSYIYLFCILDIFLDKNYFKLSIGSTILKIINCNDTFAEKVIDYMLTNQADIPQEVKNILDSNIIPAIKHTSKYTNVKTYEQLVKIAVKILRSGLPSIDIDPFCLFL